jgi:hypothetical protein
MGEVIAREVALAEIAGWAEHFGNVPDAGEHEVLMRALQAGRLSFNAEREEFVYTLLKPVELENHDILDKLTLAEPTAGQFASAFRVLKVRKDGNAAVGELDLMGTVKQVASCTGKPYSVIERVRKRDFDILQALVGFFG